MLRAVLTLVCGNQIHPVETREGGMALQFEHPTIAGVTVGGWMNRAGAQPKVVQARPSASRKKEKGKFLVCILCGRSTAL